VDLHLQRLCEKRREIDIRDELGKIPPGLNATYQRILDTIANHEPEIQTLARRSFMWVFYATRPLQFSEFLDAISVDEQCSSIDHFKDRRWNIADILEACGHLLTFEEGVVRPIHFSVREYFATTITEDSQSVLYHITRNDLAYDHLSICCLQYLSLDIFQEACRTSSEMNDLVYTCPLASHSAFSFDVYISRCYRPSSDLIKCLEKFLLNRNECLTSTHQLRVLQDYTSWRHITQRFRLYRHSISAVDVIYETALYNSPQLLLINPQWKDSKPSRFALHRVATQGVNASAITAILDSGHLINEVDEDQCTPLYYACERGNVEVCRVLLWEGADTNVENSCHITALHRATSAGHSEVVKLLLENGADVNTRGGCDGTALYRAVTESDEMVVKLLLDNGADVNAEGGLLGTALHKAVFARSEAMVKLLLENRANINVEGGRYGTVLHLALIAENETVFKLLLESGADVNAEAGCYDTVLYLALVTRNETVVKLLLENGANINAKDGQSGTALYKAVFVEDEVLVKLLLDNGADVNAGDASSGTALQRAVTTRNEALVKLLLDNGANINAKGGCYGTALYRAVTSWNEVLVKLLVENGADVNAEYIFGGTKLRAASYIGSVAMVKMLLEHGATVDYQGGDYGKFLQIALSKRNE
jgi:ankyrin repeat protein